MIMNAPCSPEQQFIADFLQFHENLPAYSDVIMQIELDKLHDKAMQLHACSVGESVARVINMYNIKPAKKKHKR
jgi:hypothetical protein